MKLRHRPRVYRTETPPITLGFRVLHLASSVCADRVLQTATLVNRTRLTVYMTPATLLIRMKVSMTRETTSMTRLTTRTGLVPSTPNPAATLNTASVKKNVVAILSVMLTELRLQITKTESKAKFTNVVHIQNTMCVAVDPTPAMCTLSIMVRVTRIMYRLTRFITLAVTRKSQQVLATRLSMVIMVAMRTLTATLLHIPAIEIWWVLLQPQATAAPTAVVFVLVLAFRGMHRQAGVFRGRVQQLRLQLDRVHRRLHLDRRVVPQLGAPHRGPHRLPPRGRRLNATTVFPVPALALTPEE